METFFRGPRSAPPGPARAAKIWRLAGLLAGCAGMVIGMAGCTTSPPAGAGKEAAEPEVRHRYVWLLSDIQPTTLEQRRDFEMAVDDVAANLPPIDLAVIAGDLLHSGSTRADFDWFLQTRDRAPVDAWFELAGNHDVRNRKLFQEYFPAPAPRAVDLGNVRLLLLSDETTQSETVISDAAFEWWWRQVLENPERILVTVSHAPLRHSGLFGSHLASRRIRDSARFEAVLPHARVALWASGHSHLPQGFYRTVHVNPKLGGTCFLNVSAIRADRYMDRQSRLLIFTEGSRVLRIRSRNHTTRRFNPRLDVVLTLDREFRWAGGPDANRE